MNALYWCLKLSMEVLKLNFIVFEIFGCSQTKNARQLRLLVIGMLIGCSFIFEYMNEDILYVVFISILMIICFLLLQKKRNMVIVIFGFIGISIIDVLIAGVICLFLGYSIEVVMVDRFILSVLNSISLIALFIVANIVRLRRKKKMIFQGKLDADFMKNLLLVGTGLLCLIVYIVPNQYLILHTGRGEMEGISLLGMTLSSILFLTIGVLALVNEYAKKRYQKESQIYKAMYQGQKDYYESIIERDRETMKLRHDIQHHFQLIGTYLADGDIELAKEYLENMAGRLENVSLVNTGNHILDIVIKDVWKNAEEIQLIWKGAFPQETKIKDIDICILFSNLLRNAIEATHQSAQEKKIEVHIKTTVKSMYIRVENPVNNHIIFKGKRPMSTKPDKMQHGFGSINIEDIVRRYNGHCEYQVDSQFSIEIILENVIL